MSDAVSLAPLVPWPIIAVLGVAAALLLAFAAVRNVRGTAFRTIAIAVLVLALLNPRVVREEREPQSDVAVVVVDDSASQAVGARRRQTAEAVDAVRKALDRFDDLEIRVIQAHGGVTGNDGNESEEGTRLFAALGRAVADVPRQRLAGAVLITDGQVHDIPETLPPIPVHGLLTGGREEMDRRLIIEKAPGYGIVGKEVGIVYRVEEREPVAAGKRRDMVKVVLRVDGKAAGSALVPVGRKDRISFTLEHAGPTVLELEAAPAEGELSTLNNRSVVAVNGVRDRLRVLLVSGQPHAGERAWRNLLKSDPSVDLVHFTILRPPEKDDFTPLKELSLIVFPVQELFETKLHEFDLIVFDRYVVRDVLPPSYLRNVGDYLRKGGAILLAVGPEFAGVRSLYQTALGQVMPAVPTGRVLEKGYRPAPTEVGQRHPVTAALDTNGADGPAWGRWFRQVEAGTRSGTVLMRGLDNLPLLVLDRVEKGRIAQLMSDHIWLWARGYEGGGPQAELMRRLAHWLMKEPDLEEEGLTAEVRDGRLSIERRSLNPDPVPVTVTAPSGKAQTVDLKTGGDGIARAVVAAVETGLYRVGDGTQAVLAASGALNPLELSDLRATADILAPVAEATGGGVAWLADGMPDIRRTRTGRQTAGRGWIGLRRNETYIVTGVAEVPLVPGFLVLALALGALMLAWYREGR